MKPIFAGRLSISSLMHHKALEPLDADARADVLRIAGRNVSGYNGADVCEEIVLSAKERESTGFPGGSTAPGMWGRR